MACGKWLLACGLLGLLAAGCKKDVLYWMTAEQIEGGPDVRWNRLAVSGDTFCIVAGGEKFERADVMISRDAGQSWTHTPLPELGKGVYGLALGMGGNIGLAGFSGRSVLSLDGGRTWQARPLPRDAYFVGAASPAAHRLVLISTVTHQQGSILLLDSATNLLHQTDLELGLNDVQFANAGIGFVAGYGAVLHTSDSGATWNFTEAEGDNFTALSILNAQTVYACGYSGSILKTSDGGQHWTRLRDGNDFSKPRYHLQDLLFTDEQHGYCVGEDGLVIYTDDRGEHWMEYERFTKAHLRSIAALPSGDLLVCGDGGALWRLRKE